MTHEVVNHLDRWDIFISSSFTEGHLVSVIEAMAMELPCFCSEIRPHLEIGEPLNFFPLDNSKKLAHLLKQYQCRQHDLESIGAISRNSAEVKFSPNVMITNYVDLYKDSLR